MTPFLYSQRLLQKLVNKIQLRDLSLFHWTDKNSLLEIVKDQRIYSKGTLWGLGKEIQRRKTCKQDAENGFIDFVFLGNRNWIEEGRPSFYGGYAIEFSPRLLLEDTEFFVFHFNTGYKWSYMKDEHRVSDLSKLLTLSGQTGEILIRRKIDINPDTILRIYCPKEDESELREALRPLDLSGNVAIYDRIENIQTEKGCTSMEYEIELEYGPFTDFTCKKIDPSQVKVEGENVWIFDKDSPCVIDLKKDGEKLLDTIDNREVGRITIKQLANH
ncbi:MAG: hypothetical protein QNJ31_09240 [Candidatus Caenarcaniphilales bacterium]|nr:hypothetical protein [Candidatus Caenarcaniphilales bacterium]